MSYTTTSGRARPTGRVTRASREVARPKVKPLPLHLQVRPQALMPTRRHPGCYTFYPVSGAMLDYWHGLAGTDYANGRGLSGKGRCTLFVQGFGAFRHHDLIEALGWKRAAESHGYTVSLIQESVYA